MFQSCDKITDVSFKIRISKSTGTDLGVLDGGEPGHLKFRPGDDVSSDLNVMNHFYPDFASTLVTKKKVGEALFLTSNRSQSLVLDQWLAFVFTAIRTGFSEAPQGVIDNHCRVNCVCVLTQNRKAQNKDSNKLPGIVRRENAKRLLPNSTWQCQMSVTRRLTVPPVDTSSRCSCICACLHGVFCLELS